MIIFDDKKVTIQSFKKILKVDDQEIVFIDKNKTISIIGNNLNISYFDYDEFIVIGIIEKVEFSK